MIFLNIYIFFVILLKNQIEHKISTYVIFDYKKNDDYTNKWDWV